MSIFKRKLSDVFKYEKGFSEHEREVLEKHFGDEMIHVGFTYPPAKETDLKVATEEVRKRSPPKTPEEEKMLKQALGTAFREKWDPTMTYGAFNAIKMAYGNEKYEEKLREIYKRARENKRELFEETMLEFCTPEGREASLKEAKQYDVPLWQTAELNRQFKTMSEGLKREVYNIAKKTKAKPVDVVKEIVRQSGKK